ncbi:guanine deaminase [Aspergillus sclerotioniger CBS 115572]|uniref:Guanine deaminase n=1 Tax=Aspergillus sclerotioniger CBS 115572 TaxID=1450535 RepID=A0A317WTC9_9EURO|nr:guanine deaminase [Aspergillus sclerotioniger CBS 115572]PWY89663.1 guanine deaminase [Aspergillus sclerotioniger CBS 115572]
MSSAMPKTTLFVHATIITINNDREIIRDGYLLVQDTRIAAIGRCPAPADVSPDVTINCTGKIILPGLINIHAHLVQSLLRGLAEDLPLHNWLCDAVWPLESSYEGRDGYHAARLTIAEMLKTGTTCFLDPMVTYRAGWENVCDAVGEMGIRGCLGKLVKFPETNRQLSITDPRDKDLLAMSIPALAAAHEKHHGTHNNRLHVWAAAGTPRGAPASLYRELGEVCAAHGISVTMYCAEAPKDREIYHDLYGCSAMEFVQDTQLCSQISTSAGRNESHNLVLAHMVNLDLDTDLPLLGATHTSVAHNPTSNLKLASGVAPVPAMLGAELEINVGLGTDGAPCSNHYDMFQEMHLAAILHKGVCRDATVVGAETALEMATINGARALRLENDVGSLEVGKKADMVVMDPYGKGGLGAAPWHYEDGGGVTAITTVVHGCTGRDVDITMVDGKILVVDGRLVGGQEPEIVNLAQLASREIRARCK